MKLLKISGGFNRIIHFRNVIQSELSESKCSQIQSRKRFHYKNLVDAGKIKVRDGVLRLIKELYISDVEQFIVSPRKNMNFFSLIDKQGFEVQRIGSKSY